MCQCPWECRLGPECCSSVCGQARGTTVEHEWSQISVYDIRVQTVSASACFSPGCDAPPAPLSRRKTRAAAEEGEGSAEEALAEIAELERQLDGMSVAYVRRQPLGFDRHWNRYWLLGAADGAAAVPTLFVERNTPVTAAEVSRLPAFASESWFSAHLCPTPLAVIDFGAPR